MILGLRKYMSYKLSWEYRVHIDRIQFIKLFNILNFEKNEFEKKMDRYLKLNRKDLSFKISWHQSKESSNNNFELKFKVNQIDNYQQWIKLNLNNYLEPNEMKNIESLSVNKYINILKLRSKKKINFENVDIYYELVLFKIKKRSYYSFSCESKDKEKLMKYMNGLELSDIGIVESYPEFIFQNNNLIVK